LDQGDDGETKWVLFQLSFFFYLILGLVGAAVSVLWLVHIVLDQLMDPPKSSLLNQVFVDLDIYTLVRAVRGRRLEICGLMQHDF